MNLQPIYPPEPAVNIKCCSCGRPFVSTMPGACADLDGAPFAAYYCAPCASRKARAERVRQSVRRVAQQMGILAAFLSLPAFAEPCKVNVNAAPPAEIQLLARTGEVLAGRIIAGRPLDAGKLDAVKGVGPSWLAVNGPHVAFSGPTTCTEKIPSPKVPRVAAQSPKL